MNRWFTRLASKTADMGGSSWAFLGVLFLIAVWGLSGPILRFSDTWQLMMNTVSSILTLIMVFLIQNAQNRDTKALHLKLDEIIHVLEPARNELIGAEDLTAEDLVRLITLYREMAQKRPEEYDKDQVLGEALAAAHESSVQ